jgi:HEPN domain-containing protein
MWAQVVKNGYDAIEQAVSAAIAAEDEAIPRRHPAKINRFIELHEPSEAVESTLHEWLRRRSEAQYVDIRGDEINIPHELFDHEDAQQMIQDAEMILQHIREQIE